MGNQYLPIYEVTLPDKCPYCGSQRFIVDGAKKITCNILYAVEKDGVKRLDTREYDVEWEVAYGVECAECGEDLTDICGF